MASSGCSLPMMSVTLSGAGLPPAGNIGIALPRLARPSSSISARMRSPPANSGSLSISRSPSRYAPPNDSASCDCIKPRAGGGKEKSVMEKEDKKGDKVVYGDELEPAQAGPGGVGGGDHGYVAEPGGEDGGGEVRPVGGLTGGLVELVTDRLLDGGRRLLRPHQRLDVVAVALVRGHASGGGVRLHDVALVLQPRHLVADGGGGDGQAGAPDNGVGGPRLGGAHVLIHDEAEQPFASLGKHVHPLSN